MALVVADRLPVNSGQTFHQRHCLMHFRALRARTAWADRFTADSLPTSVRGCCVLIQSGMRSDDRLCLLEIASDCAFLAATG